MCTGRGSNQGPLGPKSDALTTAPLRHRTISICSIYIPPRAKIEQKDLEEIVHQLPTPYLLLGDFNGHNVIWGLDDVNKRGRIIENFIDKINLCLFNDINLLTSTPLRVLTLLLI